MNTEENILLEGKHIVADGEWIAMGDANVIAYGNARINASNNATVTANDTVTVEARDDAIVIARDDAMVTARDSATVILPRRFQTREKVTLADKAICINHRDRTIMSAVGWRQASGED